MSEEITAIELTEENVESIVYEIRGQKVMLDFDLAKIYGYATRDFNNQIKHNIERFEEDFRFQLTKEEWQEVLKRQIVASNEEKRLVSKTSTLSDDLRLKKSTAKELSSKRRYNPYAFTEQGIYMLMTVLRGELAVKQSKALIRLFKRMKDYIVENKELIGYNASLVNDKFLSYDKKFIEVDEKLKIVMDNFIDPSTYKSFLILDGQKIEANLAYQTIYSLAKQSIHVIDDYINLKTLYLLRNISSGVEVTIISDNAAKDKVSEEDVDAFRKEYDVKLQLIPSNNRFHDRFIVIDCGVDSRIVYHCGGSSKDAGSKITTIHTVSSSDFKNLLIDTLSI